MVGKLGPLEKLILYAVIGVGAAVFVLPFYSMIITSLKSSTELQGATSLLAMLEPGSFRIKNYAEVSRYVPFWRYFLNTTVVTGLSCLGTVIASSLVAYSFARLRYPGRNALFFLMISTMMLPFQVTMVPVFLIFSEIGWVNTLKPLWVPAFFGSAFYIFLLRQFMLTIPRDLEDAARVDGCGAFTIYWRIVLPLVKPALVTVLIFQFLFSWNDFLAPLIYIHDKHLMTLSIGLQGLRHEHGSEWPMLLAGSTLMTTPVVVLFFFLQKYFIQGVTLTGLKQ